MPSGQGIAGRRIPIDPDREWMREAACHGTHPDLFFPPKGAIATYLVQAAKRICNGCPVRGECLAYALRNGVVHGVWGGKSEEERARLRRQMRANG